MVAIAAWMPEDWSGALLVGRLDQGFGPVPVLIRDGIVEDMSGIEPTVAQLLARPGPLPAGRPLGPPDAVFADTAALLAPIDLQCIKAAGVTFAVSAIERVIEERARGDAAAANALRAELEARIGVGLRAVRPGSAQAAALKAALLGEGLWSQYLEVAIGPDAEIFTKAPVLAAVGGGALVGIRSDSAWNNPEPEIVLVVAPDGRAVGATLGNDVNLRDFEGRSALLLGKAKDNNASCAVGPFVRLFDAQFTIDDVRAATVTLAVDGSDGYRLTGTSSMREISRDPLDLVGQARSDHDYPDGFVLFLGTMFAPVQDRDTPGGGFTHHVGDTVRIATPRLGTLENRVVHAGDAPPWRSGIVALMTGLARRGLLGGAVR